MPTPITEAEYLSRKRRIVGAWRTAFREWEQGIACSPSALDLTDIARDIDPSLPGGEDASDLLYMLMSDTDGGDDGRFATLYYLAGQYLSAVVR